MEELKKPLSREWTYYEELDKKRREIIGRFKEIEQLYGNWRFLNKALPSLFKKLKETLDATCKCILENNRKKITREAWVDSWTAEREYHEIENDETENYYILEALISDFEDDFMKKHPYDNHYTRAKFPNVIRKSRRRITNILYYFHQKAIKKLKKAAQSYFLEKFQSQLREMDFPCVTYAESLTHDFNVNFKMRQSNEKIKQMLKAPSREKYQIGLKIMWEDEFPRDHRKEEYLNVAAIYFGLHGEPFLLFIDHQYLNLLDAFKAAGEEALFSEWFHSKDVKKEIIFHYFWKIYIEYTRKDELTEHDIEHADYYLNNALEEIYYHYGMTHALQEAKHVFHEYQKERTNSDSDNVLESIFPLMHSVENKEQDPKEIIVIDLETTGLSPYSDAIVEIAACKLNLETGTIEPVFNKLCQEKNKEIERKAWIFTHSDLDYWDVYNAHYLTEYRKEIQHLLNTYPVTAYNQEFDFGFLEERGFKIRKRFWDPMHEFTDLVAIPYNDWEYKWPKVEESWYHFFPNVKYPGRHRALEDSIIEALMIREYCRNHENQKEVRE